MKKTIKSFALIILSATILFSCGAIKNANNKQKGAVIGAASGALLGGILGNNIGNKKNSVLGSLHTHRGR